MIKKSIRNKIIKSLLENKLVDEDRLKAIQDEKKQDAESDLIKRMIESDVVSDKDLLVVLSQELNIPPINISRVTLDPEVMNLVPEKLVSIIDGLD